MINKENNTNTTTDQKVLGLNPNAVTRTLSVSVVNLQINDLQVFYFRFTTFSFTFYRFLVHH